MSKESEQIKLLLKIAQNQQKIITKLAQGVQALPAPARPVMKEAEQILAALPAPVKAAVQILEVHPSRDPEYSGEVKVRFHPGKSSNAAFQAIQKTVQKLQNSNLLPGSSYLVKEV